MSEFITRDIGNFYNLKKLDFYMIGHKGFIAGGCFKNLFNNQKIKDVDIFFENEKDFFEAKSFYENHDDFYPYYENKKVVAFKHKDRDEHVELIRAVFGTPEKIINDFDFSITKFAYFKTIERGKTEEEDKIVYKIIHHKDFFEHMFLRRLVANKDLKFPNSTFERMIRYITYGYMPCKETKMNIINAIKKNTNELDKISESLYEGMD